MVYLDLAVPVGDQIGLLAQSGRPTQVGDMVCPGCGNGDPNQMNWWLGAGHGIECRRCGKEFDKATRVRDYHHLIALEAGFGNMERERTKDR